MSRAPVILNSDLIEHIDETPDTVITLTSGQKLMVQESADDIIAKVVEFRSALAGRLGCALVHSGPLSTFAQGPTHGSTLGSTHGSTQGSTIDGRD